MILAPLIRSRKGHYRDLFDQMRKQGYSKMRIDSFVIDLSPGMQVDRYKVHDIELVVDRLMIEETDVIVIEEKNVAEEKASLP